MKIANLPTGESLNFPDDMEDGLIDQFVKKILGADNESRRAQSSEEMVKLLTMAMEAFLKSQAAMQQSINGIANSLKVLDSSLQKNVLNNEKSTLLISGKLEQLTAAFTAPRELIKDKEGKPTGVKIKYN